MCSTSTDLPDIVAQLEFRNTCIQSQGFGKLVVQLRQPSNLTPKDKEQLQSLYFDCVHQYGSAVAVWACKVLTVLIEEDVLTKDVVVRECSLRLSKSSDYLDIILSISTEHLSTTCLNIMRKDVCVTREIVKHLMRPEIVESALSTSTLLVIIYCDTIPLVEKWSIVQLLKSNPVYRGYVEEIVEFKSTVLSQDVEVAKPDLFDMTVKLSSEPSSISHITGSFSQAHHLMLPALLSLVSNWSEIEKACPGSSDTAAVTKCKAMVSSCMRIQPRVEHEKCYVSTTTMNTFDYFNNLLSSRQEMELVDSWLDIIEHDEKAGCCFTDHSLLFATALLPYTDGKNTKRCIQLLCCMVKSQPCVANTLFPLLMVLYTKPYFAIDKSTVLMAIRNLVSTRFVVLPVVKLLCLLSQQNTDERFLALKYLEELVHEFPTIFDNLLPLVKISDAEHGRVLHAKVSLMKAMFIATDRSDELFPSLSALLQKEGELLATGINLVVDLCKEDVFDLSAIRRQLSAKVRLPSNIVALPEYCALLAVAAGITEEDTQNLRTECLSELWKLKDHKRLEPSGANESELDLAKARGAAWRALGCFPLAEVIETATSSDIIGAVSSIEGAELEGYGSFVHQMLGHDVEELSRTLYTKQYDKGDVISSSAANWLDSLTRSNAESPWMWTASLGLFSAVIASTSPTKRHTAGMKLFRRLLCEVPLSIDATPMDRLLLLAGWRIVMAEMLPILASSKSDDYIWARDQLTEECGRALRQTEMSLHNVLLAMAALAGEMQRITYTHSGQHSQLETAMHPWLVSVYHFNLPITDPSNDMFSPSSAPVFQVSVNPTKGCHEVARLCDYILYRIVNELGRERFDLISFNEINGTDPFAVMDASIGADSRILVAGDSASVGWKHGRGILWTIGTAFGLDSLLVSSIDDDICPSVDDQSDFMKLLDKENGDTTTDDITNLMRLSSEMSSAVLHGSEQKLRRRLDRAWSNSYDFKRLIYEGLSGHCLSTWLRDRENLPTDYSHLPEDSLLRELVAFIISSSLSLSSSRLSALLCSLAPLKRKNDGRSLPPLNWAQLAVRHFPEWKADASMSMAVLRLACQEGDRKLLYQCTSVLLKDAETHEILWNSLATVVKCLPPSRQDQILTHLYQKCQDDDVMRPLVVEMLSANIQHASIQRLLSTHLPRFDRFDAATATHFLLKVRGVDQSFRGKISRQFDFWVECRNRCSMNLLLGMYEAAADRERDVLLRIFGYSRMGSDESAVVSKMLDLVSIHTIADKSGKQAPLTLIFFLVLVCSLPAAVPICWPTNLANSDIVTSLISRRWSYYWQPAVDNGSLDKAVDTLRRFLLRHLVTCQDASLVRVVRGLIISLMARRLLSASEFLEESPDVWETVFAPIGQE